MPAPEAQTDGALALFTAASVSGQVTTLLILFLLLLGLALVLRSWLVLHRDRRLLYADLRAPTEDDSPRCPLLREHLTLLRAWGTHVQPATLAIQALDAAKVEAANAFPRWLARIFLMLGLFGTVYGLGSSIAALSEGRRAETVQAGHSAELQQASELSRRLLQSFEHMETVFVCTMAGIIAAVAMTGANALYGWRHESYVFEAERYTLEVIAPAYARRMSTSALVDASQEILSTLDGLRDAVAQMDKASHEIALSLGEAATAATGASAKLRESVGAVAGLVDSANGAVGALTDATIRVSEAQHETVGLLARTQETLRATDERMATAGEALEERLRQAADEHVAALSDARYNLTEVAAAIRAATDSAGQATASVAEQMQLTRAVLEGIRVQADERFEAVLTATEERLEAVLTEMLDNSRKALEHARTVGEEHLADLTSKLVEQQGLVRLALVELVEQLVEDVARVGEAGAQAIEKVPERLAAIEADQRSIREAIEHLKSPPRPTASFLPSFRRPDRRPADSAEAAVGTAGRRGPLLTTDEAPIRPREGPGVAHRAPVSPPGGPRPLTPERPASTYDDSDYVGPLAPTPRYPPPRRPIPSRRKPEEGGVLGRVRDRLSGLFGGRTTRTKEGGR